MAKLTKATTTNAFEYVELPDGLVCKIPKCLLVCDKWSGGSAFGLSKTYTSKPLINRNGIPLYAELVALEVMKNQCWEGVWVDSFHRKFLDGMPCSGPAVDLPTDVANEIGLIRSVYRRIAERYPHPRISKGEFGGCWDVLCWKGDELLFIDTKRKSKDRLRRSQRAWLMAALDCGRTVRSFLVVEWDFAKSPG